MVPPIITFSSTEAAPTKRGVWKVQLLVRADNAKALGFYDRLGYRDTGSVCLQKILET